MDPEERSLLPHRASRRDLLRIALGASAVLLVEACGPSPSSGGPVPTAGAPAPVERRAAPTAKPAAAAPPTTSAPRSRPARRPSRRRRTAAADDSTGGHDRPGPGPARRHPARRPGRRRGYPRSAPDQEHLGLPHQGAGLQRPGGDQSRLHARARPGREVGQPGRQDLGLSSASGRQVPRRHGPDRQRREIHLRVGAGSVVQFAHARVLSEGRQGRCHRQEHRDVHAQRRRSRRSCRTWTWRSCRRRRRRSPTSAPSRSAPGRSRSTRWNTGDSIDLSAYDGFYGGRAEPGPRPGESRA